MSKLTAQYIDNHSNEIHTFDSFGRNVISKILSDAKKNVGTGEADEITVKLEFKVRPVPAFDCILVDLGPDGSFHMSAKRNLQ